MELFTLFPSIMPVTAPEFCKIIALGESLNVSDRHAVTGMAASSAEERVGRGRQFKLPVEKAIYRKIYPKPSVLTTAGL